MWILIFIHITFADVVMIKSPTADSDAYEVFLENSDNVRPSNIEQRCADSNNLQFLLNSANDHFLNGSVEMAKKQYSEIADLRWNCDWSKEQSHSISESLLRLAQVSEDSKQRTGFLQSLVQFDPNYSPSKSLFPPPLVSEYESISRELTHKTIPLTQFQNQFVKVLRNGRPYSLSIRKWRVPSGQARYTFLSDSHHAKSFVTTPEELALMNISTTPLVSGDCKNFQFQKPSQWHQSARLFFAPECIVDQPENSLLKTPTALATANASLAANAIDLQLAEDRQPKKPWIRENAVWIATAAALVGTALVVAEMSKRKETQTVITPTNTMNNN